LTHPDPTPGGRVAEGFRGDIEGLRAVAVVLVVLYHAQIAGFGGGYVGVDVFFVLSGFLITGILLREMAGTGSISLSGFYARRLRRILPAAVLVVLVTVIASAIVLPPLQFTDVTRDAAAAVLYVPNIRFGLEATDYLQSQQAASPLLHYWSLGVEEQFYLFWPALVLLLGRGRGGFRKRIGISAIAISVVSLTASIWVTNVNAPWAFFSLPTRAWELGMGAVLAVLGLRLAALPERLAAAMGWLGLAAVALSGAILNDAVPYPGIAALVPTTGAALVICAGYRSGRFSPARLLDTPVPRYLGRISYSLYLWHWPLLVLPAAALGLPLDLPTRLALVAASVLLAAGTQRLVENPLRRGRLIGTNTKRNLAMAGALSLVVATACVSSGVFVANSLADVSASNLGTDEATLQTIIERAEVATSGGSSMADLATTPDSPVPAAMRPSLADARTVLPAPYTDGCHLSTFEVDYESPCLFGDPNGSRTVVLFGDSHALQWWPAVEELALRGGWRFYNFTKSACSPGDVFQWDSDLKRMFTECSVWRAHTMAKIAAIHPDLVIVSSLSDRILVAADGSRYGLTEEQNVWKSGLTRTLLQLSKMAGQVVMINDTPASNYDVPNCLSAHRASILSCATPTEQAIMPGWLRATADGAKAAGATLVDPTLWVCTSAPCPPVIGNFLVYRDDRHLAVPFAQALAGRLGAAIPAFAEDPGPAASHSPAA
jgi:peptidoglycan/LPS O-acetylase OafA/YrhL